MKSVSMRHIDGINNGYGYMGETIRGLLGDMGIEVRDLNEKDTGLVPPTALFVQLPGHARGCHGGQRSVLFTMFETTQLPGEYMEVLHEYDTVIVPCAQNAEIFGVYADDVRVIPLGVDPERWHFTPRKPITDREPFTFLIAGAGWKRKGFDLATEAFLQLRAETGGDMRLICKMQQNEALLELPRDKDITYLREVLTQEDEVKLYADAHCFLAPSKGEGWGLCPHQAIAQGCPTILTDAGGMAEFSRYGIPISWHHEPAVYGIWEDTGEWWVPDYDALLEAMRSVYEDPAHAFEVAENQAANIAHLTWENTVRQILEVIEVEPEVDAGQWHVFERALYPIMVSQPVECNVGGQRYVFQPGATYYEFADVKRTIYNTGLMDRNCPTRGLLPSQIDGMSAKVFRCPTCQRPYPTAEEVADEVLTELAGAS